MKNKKYEIRNEFLNYKYGHGVPYNVNEHLLSTIMDSITRNSLCKYKGNSLSDKNDIKRFKSYIVFNRRYINVCRLYYIRKMY